MLNYKPETPKNLMTTLYTERDAIQGWEANKPSPKMQDPTMNLALRVWQYRDQVIEQGLNDGEFDCETIIMLENLGKSLTNLARSNTEQCDCVLPEQSCYACILVARAVSILAENE